MEKVELFSIKIDNINLEEACKCILRLSSDKSTFSYVVTPNVDHIMKLQKDIEFLKVYDNATLITADGQPLIWASRLLNKPLKAKVSGSDLFPEVCKFAAIENKSVFFLGGLSGVAEKAAQNLKEKYPNLNVVGTYSPPFGFEYNIEENRKVIKMINQVKPDILFVGLGAPKQEKWIYNNLEEIKVPVSLAIGASFDFEAGTIKRAPIWMQNLGLEWFWRFLKEPKRLFKRYFIDDSRFFLLVLKEKLNNSIDN